MVFLQRMAPYSSTEETRQPRLRGDKRVRTRAKLLEAARDLVRERGFERTTLKDIANRAGVTTGAIYGNFKSREDLFIEIAATYWGPIIPKFKPGSTFGEKMRALAEAVIAAIPERRIAAVGALTFRTYALTHEDIRTRAHETMAKGYAEFAEWLRLFAAEGNELPMPPEILIRVLHALIDGLLFQRFLTPDLVPDEVFYAAFAALAGERRDGARNAQRIVE